MIGERKRSASSAPGHARAVRQASKRRVMLLSGAVVGIAAAATSAAAQAGAIGTGGVKGTVRDSLGIPVEGAQVTVVGAAMVGETDDHGIFLLGKASPGELLVRVRRIGFRPDSARVAILAGQTAAVDIVLNRVAVELRPVVVLGRRNITGQMAGFYERQSRGMGHFITREQIEKRNPINMTDMFRMVPGARVDSRGFRTQVRFRGARCAPLTWLDGTPLYAGEFDLDSLDPRSMEGIEIYSGPAGVPAEFQGNRNMSSSCGTVILWSRQGELRPKKRKPTDLTPAAMIARMVEQRTLFTAEQVDTPARVDSTRLVRPVYPDSLFVNGVPGRVIAEFVVTPAGDVVMDSFSAVTSTHPSLTEAVRRAVKDQPFIPAVKDGRTVQQVVQQPFTFVPDSGARRRP